MYGHIYTDEEKAFMEKIVPGHSYREIQKAFIEKFGWEISLGQIKSYIGNHHLNSGKTGCFQKGHIPSNKGKKMPAEVYEKVRHTMFPKGHMPVQHRPVGSERINVDGYIEIKVEEPKKWRLKHNVIYEQHYGAIPKGHVVVFLDGNKMNLTPENLKLISRGELAIMNKQGLFRTDPELTEASINVVKLIYATSKAKKRKDG